MAASTVTPIRMPSKLAERLGTVADAIGVSRQEFIRRAIGSACETFERERHRVENETARVLGLMKHVEGFDPDAATFEPIDAGPVIVHYADARYYVDPDDELTEVRERGGRVEFARIGQDGERELLGVQPLGEVAAN